MMRAGSIDPEQDESEAGHKGKNDTNDSGDRVALPRSRWGRLLIVPGHRVESGVTGKMRTQVA